MRQGGVLHYCNDGCTGAPGPIFCRLPVMTWSPSATPLIDRDELAVGRAERHQSLLDLVALADDIDVFAELARAERGLRHHQRVGLVADVQADADILAGQQR